MQHKSGADYFIQGFSLIRSKGVKRFVFVPLAVNLLLFGWAFWYLFGEIDTMVDWLLQFIPDALSWLKDSLSYIVWPIAVLVILLFSAYLFGTLANWIAAPFNGLLAERIEAKLTGKPVPAGGFFDLLKDIPRTLKRELTKLKYYLPRAIIYFIAFLLLPVIGQILWFMFTAWMMAVQYCDYPFDNHRIGFDTMRADLRKSKSTSFTFGGLVTLCSMVPLLNMLVMPVAICGATAMWVDRFQGDYEGYDKAAD